MRSKWTSDKTQDCRQCGSEFKITNPRSVNCPACIEEWGQSFLVNLWKRYGITVKEFTQMYKEQDGKCGICGVGLEMQTHGETSACVDHNHTTNKVRGLLCRKCNRAIGQLGDNLEGIMRAVRYLEVNDDADYNP